MDLRQCDQHCRREGEAKKKPKNDEAPTGIKSQSTAVITGNNTTGFIAQQTSSIKKKLDQHDVQITRKIADRGYLGR